MLPSNYLYSSLSILDNYRDYSLTDYDYLKNNTEKNSLVSGSINKNDLSNLQNSLNPETSAQCITTGYNTQLIKESSIRKKKVINEKKCKSVYNDGILKPSPPK